ncbi:formimidoylglutamate deiminase [Enterobacter hormaechei]|uniref:Formimidoylglutamate deiminase n=1 Tax=Phytobacter ursingii TaxID=1972431 RepID=A0AB35RW11_9ENTR|nr:MULTISPECIES: formimidoylglutamate deiminase [Enterobacteriaceae]MDV2863094.1 formimidoylglutamate deiminase [Phytobacter ursingii]GJL36200.1 formimidoylglutamate deiminase [Enterobacter hormaechei]
MPAYFAPRVLLATGWAHNVRLEVDELGMLTAITPEASSHESIPLSGPVVPGMPNLHSHAFQRVMAGLAEVAGDPQDSFWTWRELMYRMVQRLTPEQVGVIARQLYIEMLKGGYTQVAEFHYLHNDISGKPYADRGEMTAHLSAAAGDAGIGLTLLPVLYSYAGFGGQPAQAGQQRFIQDVDSYLQQQAVIQRQINGNALQNLGLCFHSLRAVTPEQMYQVLKASDPTLPVHIHIAEQQKEVNDCLNWSGQRPISWLYDHLDINARWCLIHATHADAYEVTKMAHSGAVAGLCPTTEANLGDGIFPGVDYLAQEGRWGIGSDSHVSLNVVEELRWLEYGQRLRDQRRNRLIAQEQTRVGDVLYQQALSGGAQACGVPVGQLSVGYRADWLVLDNQDPYLAAATDNALLNRWLFAGHVGQIRDVYVGGVARVVDGVHPQQQAAASDFLHLLQQLSQESA